MSSPQKKIRIAYIKFGGMTIGGSELWLQKMAANLPKDQFEIDYYYCDDCSYLGGEHIISPSSAERVAYLESNGVRVIKFTVGAKDIRTLTHDWIDTNFWEVFDEGNYDIIQTVKAGPKEYPFYKMKKPVVEIVALANRPDTSSNIAWSFHSSNWQRAQWVRLGGSLERSSVLTSPTEQPLTEEDYRQELGISKDDVVAGFIQRNDNQIASEIPLKAFKELQKNYPNLTKNWHFIIKNGGSLYRDQAKELGLFNVHFLGATPDSLSVSKFLNTLDIFAHGRKDGETFGAIFVEAMLHGKPCLSHYAEGGANAQPETMGPAGIFAYTFTDYTNSLYRLFSDTIFRKTLADKARPHALKYYSIKRCIDEATTVYLKIMNRAPVEETLESQYVSYGYSDLGFLYAGDFTRPHSIATHVITGKLPFAFDCTLMRTLLPHIKNVLEVVEDTGLYSWIAADYFSKNSHTTWSVDIVQKNEKLFKTLETTRSLNRWEESVKILGKEITLTTPYDLICIRDIDDKAYVEKILTYGAGIQASILITPTVATVCTLSLLQEKGYQLFACKNGRVFMVTDTHGYTSETSYLCIKKELAMNYAQKLMGAAKKYRKENLFFGYFKNELVTNVIRTLVPPYLTKKKIIAYLHRRLRQ
jgi:glycosyltransferase involved in cell wall biosynthesis